MFSLGLIDLFCVIACILALQGGGGRQLLEERDIALALPYTAATTII